MNEQRRIIIISVCMIFILGLGVDIYAPSLPAIQQTFNTTQQMVQFSLTTYFCGAFFGLLFLGALSDRLGRKPPLIVLTSFYIGATLMCIFAWNIKMFLLFRLLQGIGAATIGISFRSILSDVLDGRNLAKAMSYTSLSYIASKHLSPFIGGFIHTYFGWRHSFSFTSIYSSLALYIIIYLLPETHLDRSPFSFKNTLKRYKAMLSNKTFVGASICVGIEYGFIVIFNLLAPFFIQNVLKHSPIFFGHVVIIIGLISVCGILTNRFLLRKYSSLTLIKWGIYSILPESILLSILCWKYPTNFWAFILPICLIFFSTGLTASNMISYGMSLIKKGKGKAGALQSVLIIFTFLIITLTGSLVKTKTSTHISLFYIGSAILLNLAYLILIKSKKTTIKN